MPNKTILFFGAGTTVDCGFPTTNTQNELFKIFFFGHDDEFRKFINKNISILKNDDVQELINLKSETEIQKITQFIKDCFSEDSFEMQLLYNLMDMAISEKRGFGTYAVEEIIQFRKSFLCLLQILFSKIEKNVLLENPNGYIKLKKLFKTIAESELKKRLKQCENSMTDIQSKDFIFTDISYVSLNWDVLILWAMMTAHKELNNENKYYISEDNGIAKLKVFNDFSTYLNSYNTEDSDNKDWFPYNQTVAYRLNDRTHTSDKRIILFPTFFPHGQTHWLECPICGKLTMYIDKQFRTYSENFIMQNNKKYCCANCSNNELTLKNSAMLLQTNYKIKAPYIEEIQRSMRIKINEADKIIFIGYSLPSDDIEYQSIFRISSTKMKKIYLVLFQNNSKNVFLNVDEVISMCNTENKEIIDRFCKVFGKDNVKINLTGFPNSLETIIENI